MSREKRERQGQDDRLLEGKLVRKIIRIWPSGVTDIDKTWLGKLIWVETYTIGVAFQWKTHPGCISVVYKAAIRIDPVDDQTALGANA